MRFLDLTLPTAAENLALDEALLLQAEAGEGSEVLRFWEWPEPAVVLGAGCKLFDDVYFETCDSSGIPILRRASGGGTVLLGKGCLCFSLVLSYERSAALKEIRPSFGFILEQVGQGLLDAEPNIKRMGISDLAVAEKKVSGNSQQRKKTYLLHHGTLLHSFAIPLVKWFLRAPTRQPDYRCCRDHDSFLANLSVPVADLKRRLQSVWEADQPLTDWPRHLVQDLVEKKYGQREWTRRR